MPDNGLHQGGCAVRSPHFPLTKRVRGRDVKVEVFCNRPRGHAGNHAWSDGRTARTAEWEPNGKVVR